MARISLRTLASMCRRVGSELKSGIDVRAVWKREADRGRGAFRGHALRIWNALERGDSLADAFAQSGSYFPRLVLEMVDVGERTGHLDEIFLMLAEQYDHARSLRRSFLLGILWPALQLAAGVFVIGLFILVLGYVTDEDVLGLGVTGWTAFLLYVAGVTAAALAVALPVVAVSRGWLGETPQWVFYKLPLLGTSLRTMALSRLAWTIAMAHEAGIDAHRTAAMALRSTQNPYFVRHTGRVESAIMNGSEVHEALRTTGAFPSEFLDDLETAERAGRVTESMQHLSHDYRARAQTSFGILTMIAGFGVWGCVAVLFVAVIFRLFYLVYYKPIYEAMEMLP